MNQQEEKLYNKSDKCQKCIKFENGECLLNIQDTCKGIFLPSRGQGFPVEPEPKKPEGEQCRLCKGKGEIPNDGINCRTGKPQTIGLPCYRCKGTGKEPVKQPEKEKCPECKGTGEVIKEIFPRMLNESTICGTCKGTGLKSEKAKGGFMLEKNKVYRILGGRKFSFRFSEGTYLGTVPNGFLRFKLSGSKECLMNGGDYEEVKGVKPLSDKTEYWLICKDCGYEKQVEVNYNIDHVCPKCHSPKLYWSYGFVEPSEKAGGVEEKTRQEYYGFILKVLESKKLELGMESKVICRNLSMDEMTDKFIEIVDKQLRQSIGRETIEKVEKIIDEISVKLRYRYNMIRVDEVKQKLKEVGK